jgi:hypothetical protein
MGDGNMKRKHKMEDSSRSLREKHLKTPVKIKFAHHDHGISQDKLESSTLPEVG